MATVGVILVPPVTPMQAVLCNLLVSTVLNFHIILGGSLVTTALHVLGCHGGTASSFGGSL
jgi:hypothetical protein